VATQIKLGVLVLLSALVARPTAAGEAPVSVTVAELPAIQAAIKAPGAKAVLVNVWATWCEPCRAELPALLRFYKDRKARGLRLVMVSVDGETERATVEAVLHEAGFDGPAFIKRGNDDEFVNAIEPRWSGAIPVTVLYDGAGGRKQFWPGPVGEAALDKPVATLLSAPPPPKPRRRP
jgi:thiol-disulfide isomerase/thioredoxin